MMMTDTGVCIECRHDGAEHDDTFGCRHYLDKDGERYFCVCYGFKATQTRSV